MAPLSLRTEWLEAVLAALQQSVERVLTERPYDCLETLGSLATSLPPARDGIETFVLHSLLIEHACKAGLIIHAGLHGKSARACRVNEIDLLKTCMNRGTAPVVAFTQWLDRLTHLLHEAHPPTAFDRSLKYVRAHYAEPLREAGLARHAGISTSQLRRSFRQTYGLSMRAYVERLRLLAALDLVKSEKIDGIGALVGYPSKSNFYRAFRRLFRRTPLQCRQLTEESRERLAHSHRPIAHVVGIQQQTLQQLERRDGVEEHGAEHPKAPSIDAEVQQTPSASPDNSFWSSTRFLWVEPR